MADSASSAAALSSSAPTGSDIHPHYYQPETTTGAVKVIGHDFVVWYHKHFSVEDLVLFLLCLVGGVVVSFLLQRVAGGRLRNWVGHKDPILGDRIVRALTGPLWVFVCFFFFTLGLDQLDGLPRSAARRVGELAPLVYILAGFLFSFRCMDILSEVLKRRWADEDGKLDEQWAKLIGGLGKVLVVLLGILTILPKDRILPLLTGASFLGAGFALASKSTIENIIGSFEIMVDRLFKEGDRISFQNYDGFVTRIGLRSVQITSMTGERITLPNKAFVDQQIHNCSRKKKVLTTFVIGLVYEHTRADLEQAMTLLQEIIDAHPKAETKAIFFKGFGPSSLDIQVAFWGDYTNGTECAEILSRINLEIKDRFDAAKLSMAFPTSTVYVKNEAAPEPPEGRKA